MNERLMRVMGFLDKCEVLEETEEYGIAQDLRESAMWARVRFESFRQAGFAPSAAFQLLLAEMSSPTIEFYQGDESFR